MQLVSIPEIFRNLFSTHGLFCLMRRDEWEIKIFCDVTFGVIWRFFVPQLHKTFFLVCFKLQEEVTCWMPSTHLKKKMQYKFYSNELSRILRSYLRDQLRGRKKGVVNLCCRFNTFFSQDIIYFLKQQNAGKHQWTRHPQYQGRVIHQLFYIT